jgi:hypothetical protein
MSERYGAIESCIELARLESVRRNFEDDAFEAYRTNSSLDFLCFNATGSTLTKGTVVYISGVQGDKPKVIKADASTEMTSSKVVGLVFRDIPDMEEGLVIEAGEIIGTDGDELDTSAFTAGDLLWLSTTAGEITNVRPTQPDHAVFIGYCLRSHPNAGAILVNIINGFELDELHDVLITTPTDGQVLAYEASTSLWKNVTPSGGGGVEVLASFFVDESISDDGVDAAIVTLPAGKLASNGDSLRLKATLQATGTVGTSTITPYFGTYALGSYSFTANGVYVVEVLLTRASNAIFRATLNTGIVASNVYTVEDTASSVYFDSARIFKLDISTNNANRTLTFKTATVEFLPAP